MEMGKEARPREGVPRTLVELSASHRKLHTLLFKLQFSTPRGYLRLLISAEQLPKNAFRTARAIA
jgi:hypothetical protein